MNPGPGFIMTVFKVGVSTWRENSANVAGKLSHNKNVLF